MDLSKLFDSFYDRLLLRDLFGKIVPGTILLISIGISFFNININIVFEKMSFIPWIIFSGFAWLMGFALQYLGELCRLLKTYPPLKDMPKDREAARKEFYSKWWLKFQKNPKDFEKVHSERLNIIKEACGNGAISLIFSVIIILFNFIISKQHTTFVNPLFLIIILLLDIILNKILIRSFTYLCHP